MNRRDPSNRNGESSKGSAHQRRGGTGRVTANCESDFYKNYKKRDERRNDSHRNDRNNGQRNGNEFRSHNQRFNDFPKHMAYKRLIELNNKYSKIPNDLLMSLQCDNSFLNLIADNERLKGKLCDYEFICHVFRALAIIIESDRDLLIPYLTKINEKEFESPIMRYLVNFTAFLTKDKDLHLKAFDNLVRFLRGFQLILPKASRIKVSLISPHLSQVVITCNKKNDVILEETALLVEEIKADVEKASENLEIDDIKEAKEELLHSLIKPPNDFRSIPICPTIEDIHQTGTPFLRSNIVKGKYVEVDHYLDVQFRLLREDFVRPLREGIAEYLSALKSNKHIRKLKDIRLYTGVHIGLSSTMNNGLIYEATFDTTNFKNLRWNFSKRLIYGSMLCLSSNNFETFCFATVAGKRDPDLLAKGKFKLQFETQSLTEEFIKITPLTTLTVIESEAYFEAYRHNLLALQRFTKEEFPLQDYIINVSSDVQNLPHLSSSTNYDLSDLAVPLIKINSDELNALSDSLDARYADDTDISLMNALKSEGNVDHIKRDRLKCVNILNDMLWPDNKVCDLDESQYHAFKTALIKQMVVIQGPPGTGKTFVGLRIVQTLLRNQQFWNNYEKTRLHPSPILIVCYTNHALDQFLEGMVPFVKRSSGMVRIGGRSQSDLLEKYSLLNVKRQMQSSRNVPEHVFRSLSNCKRELELIQRKLSSAQTEIQKSTEKLLDYDLRLAIERLNTNYNMNRVLRVLKQLEAYDESFDLALFRWLTVDVQEVNREENYESDEDESNLNSELIDDFDAKLKSDDQLNEEIEIDDQELQFILNSRIFEDEEQSDEGSPIDPNTLNQIVRDNQNNALFVENDKFIQKGLTKSKRNRIQKQIQYNLNLNDSMSEREALLIYDIKQLSTEDRWRLYRYWRQLYCHEKETQIEGLNKEYLDYVNQYNRLRIEEDLCAIRGCEIIGVTTTGAAKYRTIIEQIDPFIVVVEEAAEVLESHVVTSLTKSTKHLILIGDHQQLKPNPTVYELAKRYNLEVSLFERMIKNGLPFHQLKVQHRMRPCISSLLVPHIYKELRDHESVQHYEDIKGISKNMFFINHSEMEASLNDTKSKLNKYEAEFIVRLCRYIVLQQYKASQITILTMYSGQLFQVKQLLRADTVLNGIRATVLDNYQGEECDIILLSFVRSNIEGDIGFLKVSNRVNVALSRARMGMYCIGNFDCLSEQSDLWKNIRNDLIEEKAIGTGLELICQNHNKKTLVSKASDFSQVPEGGCTQPCSYRLDCGHVCPRSCHIYDMEHKTVNCNKKCDQIVCDLKHRCPDRCHDPNVCQPCDVRVDKTRPSCGHQLKVKCSSDPNDAFCHHKCEKVLICGHKCTQVCGVICSSVRCKTMVTIDTICGHKMQIECSKRLDLDLQLKYCDKECGVVLECGHICQGSCGDCQQKRFHRICRMKCERILICGHVCRAPCGLNCPPCDRKCDNVCLHSKCNRKCGVPCAPCQEPCLWKCIHKSCKRLCNESCDRDICLESCPKMLECKHQCIGICGEPCPKKCRVCHKNEVQELFFGDEDEPDSRFIELQDCGHVIEFSGLIKWLMQSNDDSVIPNPTNRQTVEIQMKSCPKCKTIIRKSKLFNSSIQQSLRDVELIKRKHYGIIKENKKNASQLIVEIENYYLQIGGDHISKLSNHRITNIGLLPKNAFIVSTVRSKIQNLISDCSRKFISKADLMLLENKFQIIKKIVDIKDQLWNAKNRLKFNRDFVAIFKMIDAIDMRVNKFLDFIHKSFVNNNQQINDSQNEMSCYPLICETLKELNNRNFNEEGRKLLLNAFEGICHFGPFTDSIKIQFKALVDKAIKLQGGLGLSPEEKEMVMMAMDFSKGHWFKCPNDHIYCIGECGGATQTSVCPECKAPIGGSSHRLLSTNRVATEMDGATQPAFGPHVPFNPLQFQ